MFLFSSHLINKRKKIIFHAKFPKKQLELKEFNKESKKKNKKTEICKGIERNCGDVLFLMVEKKDNVIKDSWFCGKHSCLLSAAVADIMCLRFKGEKINVINEILDNCYSMTEKEKEYDLEICKELLILKDISNFPSRVECVRLVIRGFKNLLFEENMAE